MDFKSIKAEDYAEIAKFFRLSSTRFCDFSTGALFMWADFFDNKFCIHKGALIISGRDIDGLASFTPPLCTEDNEWEVLRDLYEHSRAAFGYLKLYPVPEDRTEYYKNILTEISGGQSAEDCFMEDWFDYVYSAEDLLNLTGKKYHGQRNFINRFIRENPDFSVELIDKKNIDEAKALASALGGGNDGDDKLEAYENMSVLRLLYNFDSLSQEGYIIRVNGVPVAFTVGEVVRDTLFEHIEKADKKYAGIFPFMSNQYLRLMKERHPEITLVNREEDLGDKGIRYSKECYHPLFKNYKYFVLCGEKK